MDHRCIAVITSGRSISYEQTVQCESSLIPLKLIFYKLNSLYLSKLKMYVIVKYNSKTNVQQEQNFINLVFMTLKTTHEGTTVILTGSINSLTTFCIHSHNMICV